MSTSEEDVYVCLSFSSYSSDRLAKTAGQIAVERRSNDAAGNEGDSGDADFEFVLARENKEVSSLEEYLYDGQNQIRLQGFPLFNRDLLIDNDGESGACAGSKLLVSSVANPLSKLFTEEDQERDYPPSCSSSEADELENVPAGTYCVWRPKVAEAPMPSQCKKSKSTGSTSMRWKIRDLLRRCKSDGRDSFVFLTTKHKEEKSGKSVDAPISANRKGLRSASVGSPRAPSAHAAFYVRNKAMKEVDKKKSYLPYKQELVGLFAANLNGLSRSRFPHF